MGSIVYYINREYGFDEASVAALKQASYNFLIGGAVTQVAKNIAQSQTLRYKTAIVASGVIPGIITSGLTYALHSLKGTPQPLESTLPTLLLAPLSLGVIGFLSRRKLGKNKIDDLENILDINNPIE